MNVELAERELKLAGAKAHRVSAIEMASTSIDNQIKVDVLFLQQ